MAATNPGATMPGTKYQEVEFTATADAAGRGGDEGRQIQLLEAHPAAKILAPFFQAGHGLSGAGWYPICLRDGHRSEPAFTMIG
jgi:hypothetical protein